MKLFVLFSQLFKAKDVKNTLHVDQNVFQNIFKAIGVNLKKVDRRELNHLTQ